MDQTLYTTVLGMMAAAVAALFGVIWWMWRWTIQRLDDRIKVLESREDTTLHSLAEAIKPIPSLMQAIIDGLKELRIAITYQRSGTS